MKPLAKKPSAAAVAMLRQATALAPKRLKASDGLLPSAAHLKLNPNSDHNTGLAVDLTHDPKNGIDCVVIFEKLKEDPRVEYLIFAEKIWSRSKSRAGNRPYGGANPHHKHLHVSITADSADDTSPWFWWLNQPKVTNQIRARLQPAPKKKTAVAPVCTCCKLHNSQRKAP